MSPDSPRVKSSTPTRAEQRHGTWWRRWPHDGVPDEGDAAFESRFVRYLPKRKADYPAEAVTELGQAMTAAPEEQPTPEGESDPEENRGTAVDPGITAAYTYLGQFIDHDLTFDPVSSLHGRPLSDAELARLIDFRTPRLDLDNLYGRGPADQPYLFEDDGLHLLEGPPLSGNPNDPRSCDVPRGPNGRALIGDPRNDENRILAQLQATMLRFHNRMVDLAVKGGGELTLADVQDQVRWHYQWAVVHDFLPTVVQPDVLHDILPGLTSDPATTDDRPKYRLPYLRNRADNPKHAGQLLPRVPVEFSVAAYRFGHSMIRPVYRINSSIARRPIFGGGNAPNANLGGMRPIPDDWGLDWQFFIDVDAGAPQPATSSLDDPVARTPQFAYKIDTSLVNPLGNLPAAIATNPSSLGERNLQRGIAFSLPTGEQAAEALDVRPLEPDDILIGKATGDEADRMAISEIAGGAFTGHTPLWTYVLAEAWSTSWARAESTPPGDVVTRLGPVGGHLVAETIMAFLDGDPGSYLNQPNRFKPAADLTRDSSFGLAEIIRTAVGH